MIEMVVKRLFCLLAIIKYLNSSKEELMASKYLLSVEGDSEDESKDEFIQVLAVLDNERFRIENEQLKYQAKNCSTSKTQHARKEDEGKSLSDKSSKNAARKMKRKSAQQKLREKEEIKEDDPKIKEFQEEILPVPKKDNTQKITAKVDSPQVEIKSKLKGDENAARPNNVSAAKESIRKEKDTSPHINKPKPISDSNNVKSATENKKPVNDTSKTPSTTKPDVKTEKTQKSNAVTSLQKQRTLSDTKTSSMRSSETALQKQSKLSDTKTSSTKNSETASKSKPSTGTEKLRSTIKPPSNNNLEKLKQKSADKFAALADKVGEKQKLKSTPKIKPAIESGSSESKKPGKLSAECKVESPIPSQKIEGLAKCEIPNSSENRSKKETEASNVAKEFDKKETREKPKLEEQKTKVSIHRRSLSDTIVKGNPKEEKLIGHMRLKNEGEMKGADSVSPMKSKNIHPLENETIVKRPKVHQTDTAINEKQFKKLKTDVVSPDSVIKNEERKLIQNPIKSYLDDNKLEKKSPERRRPRSSESKVAISALDLAKHVTANKIDKRRETLKKNTGKEGIIMKTDGKHSQTGENISEVSRTHKVETMKETQSPNKAEKVLESDTKRVPGSDRSSHKAHVSPDKVKNTGESHLRSPSPTKVEIIRETRRGSSSKSIKESEIDSSHFSVADGGLEKTRKSPCRLEKLEDSRSRSTNKTEKVMEIKHRRATGTDIISNTVRTSPAEVENIRSGSANKMAKPFEDSKHLSRTGKGLEKSQRSPDTVEKIRDSRRKSLESVEKARNTTCKVPQKIEKSKERFYTSAIKRVPETFSKNPNISCASVVEKSKYVWSPKPIKSESVLNQTTGSTSTRNIKNYQPSNLGDQTSNAEYTRRETALANCPPRQRKQFEDYSNPYQYSHATHQDFNNNYYNPAILNTMGHIPSCNPFTYPPTHTSHPSFYSGGIIRQNNALPYAHHTSVSQNPNYSQLPMQRYIAQKNIMPTNYQSRSNADYISSDSRSSSPEFINSPKTTLDLKQKSTPPSPFSRHSHSSSPPLQSSDLKQKSPFSPQRSQSSSPSPQPSPRPTSIVITPPPDQPERKIDWEEVALRRRNSAQSRLRRNSTNAESWSELGAKELSQVPRERWANSDPDFKCRSLYLTSTYWAPEEHNILGRWINPNSLIYEIPEEDIFSPLVDDIYHRYRSSFYDIIFTEAMEYERVQYTFCKIVLQMVIDNLEQHYWGRLEGKITLPINPIQPAVVRVAVLLKNTLALHMYHEAAFNCVIRWTTPQGDFDDKNFFVSLGPKHDLTSWFIYTGTGEWGEWEDMMDEDSNPAQVWSHITLDEEEKMELHRAWKKEKLKRGVRDKEKCSKSKEKGCAHEEIVSEVDLDKKSPWLSRGKDSIQILCEHYSSK